MVLTLGVVLATESVAVCARSSSTRRASSREEDGKPSVGMVEWFDTICAATKEGGEFKGLINMSVATRSYYAFWESVWITEPKVVHIKVIPQNYISF